jgi:hypothetical protein
MLTTNLHLVLTLKIRESKPAIPHMTPWASSNDPPLTTNLHLTRSLPSAPKCVSHEMPLPRLRVRLHWSQNRHNTANQHLSGYTLQERVATFKPTTVLSIATTFDFHAHCSKYLARLSARNKLTLLVPDIRGR